MAACIYSEVVKDGRHFRFLWENFLGYGYPYDDNFSLDVVAKMITFISVANKNVAPWSGQGHLKISGRLTTKSFLPLLILFLAPLPLPPPSPFPPWSKFDFSPPPC